MEQASYMEFRQHLTEYIGKARYAGTRILVKQRGKPVGAFISLDDLETLQSIENSKDLSLYEEVKKNGEFVDWNDVRQKLIRKHGYTKDELHGKA